MLKQHLFYLGLLTAAVGVPYSASEWKTITRWVLEGGAASPVAANPVAVTPPASAQPPNPSLIVGWGQTSPQGAVGPVSTQFAGYGSDNSYGGIDSPVFNSPFATGNDASSASGKTAGSSSVNSRGGTGSGSSTSGANSYGSSSNSGNTYSGNSYGGSSNSGNSYTGQSSGTNSYSSGTNNNSGGTSSGWNSFGTSGNNSDANSSTGTSSASNGYGGNNYNSSNGNYTGSSSNSYSSSTNKSTNYGGSTNNNTTGKSNSWGSSSHSDGDGGGGNQYGSSYSSKKAEEPATAKSTAEELADIEPAVKPADICLVGWDEALRFEVTEPWIMQRWNRVNTSVAHDSMRGYRVPLVTGAGEEDLAGALTYYFDQEHLCQRVAFRGTTGDPTKLVTYLSQRFGLEAVTSTEPGVHLYQIRWNGRALSELKITPAPVIRASSPHLRYQVEFNLNAR
ncbi:MAG: DUF6690 family protein [Pirellulales bacterium]|nr:DUF6690 family protein [Pirellulales bacterium]